MKDLESRLQDCEARDLGDVAEYVRELRAVLRKASECIEGLLDTVECYGGREDDGRARYATFSLRNEIAVLLRNDEP